MLEGTGTLFLQSFVATSMSNLDSSRARNPSQEKRKEGWTEQWSNVASASSSGSTAHVDHHAHAAGALIQNAAASSSSSPKMTLIQFRPAWFEQLVLRMAGIPHVVQNSPYAATESTGPLPLLQTGTTLVGHHQPQTASTAADGGAANHTTGTSNTTTATAPNDPLNNDILNHLQQRSDWKLDQEIAAANNNNKSNNNNNNNNNTNSQAHLVSTLVQSQLQPALQVLRFKDTDAWQQIYRPLYISAGQGGLSSSSSLLPLGAWFQAWSLRVVSTKQHDDADWTLAKAKRVVHDCYVTLEAMLLEEEERCADNSSNNNNSNNSNNCKTILGTKELTTIDALLWAHLADALCDVHVVTILASFPNLVRFFQRIRHRYFASLHEKSEDFLLQASQRANADNVFTQQLPLLSRSKYKSNKQQEQLQPYKHALELMQSLRPNLQNVLFLAKETRRREAAAIKKEKHPQESMIYAWRMGASKKREPWAYTSSAAAEEDAAESPAAKKWRADHKSNDELWISCVVGVTALAMVFGTAAAATATG